MAEGSGFAGYGYTDSGGERIAALIDMINGGGAGRAGQQFEGGGILSLIANALFSPYGSQARGADSPATAPRPTARPTGGAPSPAPSGLPSLRGPAGGPPPAPRPSPAAATAPALRGPAGGPPPSAPAARPAPAMPTGGPGTFAPGRLPAARTPAMTGAPSAAEMLESYLASATPPPEMSALPADPAAAVRPIYWTQATGLPPLQPVLRVPWTRTVPFAAQNLPAGPNTPDPMASVEGPMLPEMLDAAPPPADSVLMGSFPFPDYPVRNETQAESLIRNTPRVPSGGPALAVGDFAGKTPAEVARGVTAPAGAPPTRALPSDPSVMASLRDYPVRNETQAESLIRNTPRVPSDSRPATPMGLRDRFVTRFDPGRPPGARPRARPQEFTFEYFVESLGPAAEGVSPEILRTAYRNFLQGYEAN